MNTNFNLLSENENRCSTRSFEFNFFLPGIGPQGMKTFFYTGIKDWNALPNNIKEIKNEERFKEKIIASEFLEAVHLATIQQSLVSGRHGMFGRFVTNGLD